MPKSDKITKVEKLKRVQKVMELLASGHRRAQIQQYAAEHSKWNVSEDMVDRYISDANRRVIESFDNSDLQKAIAHTQTLITNQLFKCLNHLAKKAEQGDVVSRELLAESLALLEGHPVYGMGMTVTDWLLALEYITVCKEKDLDPIALLNRYLELLQEEATDGTR